jgi:RNA polymerase sigma factor (sigma-70 family)
MMRASRTRAKPMSEPTDTDLLEAWRAGDKPAGNALLTRHFAPLLRFFENKVGADADELIQRTMLACVESHHRLRGEASFRTYLFTVARHELYRFLRRRAAHQGPLDFGVSSLVDLETSASARLIRRERIAALAQALQQLPLDDQIMLELFYSEEFDSRALAEIFGIEPSSVRARLHRARAAVESLLRRGERSSGS